MIDMLHNASVLDVISVRYHHILANGANFDNAHPTLRRSCIYPLPLSSSNGEMILPLL